MLWLEELNKCVLSWKGTPHMDGQCMKGRGVDCVHFVAAVLDELEGTTTLVPKKAKLTGVFSREESMKVCRAIARAHDHTTLHHPKATDIMPGDVLVVAAEPNGSSPGHVMIAGVEDGSAWHVTSGSGVSMTGIGGYWKDVLMVWRPTNKEQWKCTSLQK